MTIRVRGTEIMVSAEEEQRYSDAERQFKAAERRAALLGRLATHKARMMREISSYGMNIQELRQGASQDLVAAINADIQEITAAMISATEARRG